MGTYWVGPGVQDPDSSLYGETLELMLGSSSALCLPLTLYWGQRDGGWFQSPLSERMRSLRGIWGGHREDSVTFWVHRPRVLSGSSLGQASCLSAGPRGFQAPALSSPCSSDF